ncbi:MAG: dihydroorotase [bacterium]|nr:dihydroorotase [bacterium]
MRSLLVRGGRVVSTGGVAPLDVSIENGRVAALGPGLPPAPNAQVIEAAGKLVFPGLVDPQVHFREPGLEHKEDLASGALAAIAGGVTTFLEMPNTKPPTTSPEALADKVERATGRCAADFGFFLGASPENADRLGEWENAPGCCGIKLFMGSSTGNLLVRDDETIERVLRSGERRVAVHSEDDFRLAERYAALEPGTPVTAHPDVRDVECAVRSTRRLLDLVEKTRRPVHVLHLSTAEEIELLRERDLAELVTCEVTPNHLFLEAPDCYERFGTFAQMNPPVRDRRHLDVLRQALVEGTIDCIGSDHAPHTRDEKARLYPESPSGIAGVQTILPLLLTGVRDGWLTLEDVVRVTCVAPVRVWDLAQKGELTVGGDGDLVIVDPEVSQPLPLEWLESRARSSPYAGRPLAGWPQTTVLRGEIAYAEHALVEPVRGQPVTYS